MPAIIGPFFIAYNLLMLAFAWGIHDALRNPDRGFVAGAALLAFSGLLGLVVTLFPMDAVGAQVTVTGAVHIAIAALMFISSMACLLVFALGWRAAGAHGWSAFNFASLAIVFVSGGLAAMGAAQAWPYAGLLERLTIGAFLVWVFIFATMQLALGAPGGRRSPSGSHYLPRSTHRRRRGLMLIKAPIGEWIRFRSNHNARG